MNSALNPEAPEFYPHLTTVTQQGYTAVNKTIRSSNLLPSGASYKHFKTLTDFNIVTCQLSKNVITQSNQIINTELPSVKLKMKDNEFNMEKIVDANDCILDHVNINIDAISGINKTSKKLLDSIKPGSNVSSWNKNNNAPVITKIQMGSTTFIGAKNIPRPQLTFKDTIDNSDSMWVPKISDKPNSIKPLALNILYNDEGEAIGYEHPYKVELDLYQPPVQFVEPDPSPPQEPASLDKTKRTFVDTEPQLDELIKHLTEVNELAVDLEHHSYRTYQGITCLIQITTKDGDFIIDSLAIREHIHKLNLIFTDPKKLKVFHGAEMDVLWLQRDFGVYVVGLFDTHKAAKALNLSGLSLKHLLMKYCQVDADKKYQLADWRIRPLPEELLQYAQMDTHYLLYIWRKMKADLLKAGSGKPQLLHSVFEQSRQICGTTYQKEVIHDNSHMPLYRRSKKSFNSQQMTALQLLYKWRDTQARILDESTTYLLPNHMLLTLAETLPREVQGVTACCDPVPPFVKQNLITIHRMLLTCRELPVEPQLFQMPSSIRNMVDTANHQPTYNLHDFSHFPDFREDQYINLDHAAVFIKEFNDYKADIEIFTPTYNNEKYVVVSNLNAEAKLFIPPYDRYRKYRSIAQLEELKEFKDKEAKVAAISKGNELIKEEILIKINQAKTQLESSEEVKSITSADMDTTAQSKAEKRKRKMSSDKIEENDIIPSEITERANPLHKGSAHKSNKKLINPFAYKNQDYKKFYNDKVHVKQPKMKFKKRK